MSHCVQMGHVPRTRGATGAPGEQAYNRAVAAEAAPMLRAQGEIVVLIGADAAVPRTGTFTAIHYDGSVSPSARGASVGYRPGRATTAASQALAHAWKVAYQRLGFAGGFRGDNYTKGLSGYYGTGRAHRAGTPRAWILEGGFGSHPTEGPWLRSRAGISTCARAIVMALTGSAPDVPPSPPEQEDETMKFDEKSERVRELQHAINRWMALSGGWAGIESLGPLTADAHLGPRTATACWHALERARLAAPEDKRPRSLYVDHNNPSPVAVGYITAAITARAAS